MNWWKRLLQKRKMEDRLQAELQFHIERQIADNIRTGMAETEARRQAQLKFGGMEQTKEECRDVRGTLWVESLFQDIRLAARSLAKGPGFTATVICTLALGIGPNSAIFQLLDAARLRSLPVKDPQRLVNIQIKGGNHSFGVVDNSTALTFPLWQQIQQRAQGLSGAFAWASSPFLIGRGTNQRGASALLVSGDAFQSLGVVPVKGRLFTRDDDRSGCGMPGVVISYDLWQGEFGGTDSVIGKQLFVLGHAINIIGVTPKRFFGLEVGQKFDFSLPFCSLPALVPGDDSLKRRDFFWVSVMGRLKPSWTVPQVSSEMQAISPGIFEATVPTGYQSSALAQYKRFRLTAYPGGHGIGLEGAVDVFLVLLLGITELVLLIACTNIANLMLARASSREREMAVRLTLGASRVRLLRQLFTEGLLLAAGGAAIGIFLSSVFSRTLLLLLTTERYKPYYALTTNWHILAFTSLVAAGTCLIFDLIPAFRVSRIDPNTTIKAGGVAMTAKRGQFLSHRMLVISQLAVSLVLVVGAFLFVRTFWNLATLDPGFREKGLLLTYLKPSASEPAEAAHGIIHKRPGAADSDDSSGGIGSHIHACSLRWQ